jgi:O-antigen/teichoic acid export membrane protein/thymidylate kinase
MIQTASALMRRYSHINWVLVDQTMVSGVNFLTGILLARYLGIEEFGRFTLVWMAMLFVNSIQHAAINSPMMSLGPKQSEAEAPAYYGAIVIQQIVFSCVVFLLLFAGVRWSSVVFPEWRVQGLALPLATSALAFQFQDFLRRYFFTRGHVAVAFVNDAIRYLGQIAVLIWMFMFFPDAMDITMVLWIIAIMAAFATAFGAFFVERIEFNPPALGTITRRHWHFSKWLTASALMHWTTGNLFIVAAGALLGTSAVGALKAAQNLMGVVHILFMGLENIVPVGAARHFHVGGKKALCGYLKHVSLFGVGATLAVALLAFVAPELWLRLVFGLEYQGYGYLLQWYAVIYILIFLSLPLRSGLRAIEHTRNIFWGYLLATLFSLLAAYPMTKYFDLSGVVGGLMTVNLILVLTLWFGFKRKLKWIESLEDEPRKGMLINPLPLTESPERSREYDKEIPIKTNSDIAKRLCLFLNERKIKYAILGDTSRFPRIETDLDLCTASYHDFLQALKDFSKSEDVSIINILYHATGIRIDLSATTVEGNKIILLGPDVLSFPTWRIKGNIGLSYKELLQSRIFNRSGFYVPSPKYAFLFYLVKKIDKGNITPRQGEYLSRVWSEDPNGSRQILLKMWPQPYSDLLICAAETGSWEKVNAAIPELFSELQKKSVWDIRRAIWILKRTLFRVFSASGLSVAVLGPDGSGKSSVIGRVLPNLIGPFRDSVYIHLRPGLGRKKNQKPAIDPHGQGPRNLVTSSAKVLYLWFDYFVGWWLTVRPKMIRSTLVVFDRFYHDMLVDPKRYRHGGPLWLARLIGRLIPKPDLWILLDAPPEVIQERKQEVSFEETARQRGEYLKLIKGMKNGIVIDASQALDDVVVDVNAAILNFMVERTEKRFG